MNDQESLLEQTGKQCLQSFDKRKSKVFTKLFLAKKQWQSSQRVLLWNSKESKKRNFILKLHAAPKLAKKYLDLLPTPTTQEIEHNKIANYTPSLAKNSIAFSRSSGVSIPILW